MGLVKRLLAVLLVFAVAGATTSTARQQPKLPNVGSRRIDGMRQHIKQLISDGDVLLIDGDNVRGKTKFMLSKEELSSSVQNLVQELGLRDRVCLLFDHGSQHAGYYLNDTGLAVVFSGPGRSVDDVIARDVVWFKKYLHTNVAVVTEDHGLKRRCRSASLDADKSKKQMRGAERKIKKEERLAFVASPLFAELMLSIRDAQRCGTTAGITTSATSIEDTRVSTTAATASIDSTTHEYHTEDIDSSAANSLGAQIELIKTEVDLRTRISKTQTALKTCNRKAAPKLKSKLAELERRLVAIIEAGNALSSSSSDSRTIRSAAVLDRIQPPASLADDNVGVGNHGTTAGDMTIVTGDGAVSSSRESKLSKETAVSDSSSSSSSSSNDDTSSSGANINSINSIVNTSILDRGADLVSRILAQGRVSREIEETWERVILAERMRERLEREEKEEALADGVTRSCRGELSLSNDQAAIAPAVSPPHMDARVLVDSSSSSSRGSAVVVTTSSSAITSDKTINNDSGVQTVESSSRSSSSSAEEDRTTPQQEEEEEEHKEVGSSVFSTPVCTREEQEEDGVRGQPRSSSHSSSLSSLYVDYINREFKN